MMQYGKLTSATRARSERAATSLRWGLFNGLFPKGACVVLDLQKGDGLRDVQKALRC
jgi:hypothetical protein